MPPSTGRPTPLTNREASEARNTTASAMSETSPSRPEGVRSTTAPTASSGEAKRPSSAMSTARPWPIAVHEPGIDAVDAYAVPELAGLDGRDPGQPVDRGLRGGVHGDAGEGDRRRHRRDVDDA